MAIQIIDEVPAKALTYNQIFMMCLSVDQKVLVNENDAADYSVKITYRKYAVDDGGAIHYDSKVDMIVIENYIPEALAKAIEGDLDMLNALGAIQIAITQIIAEKRNMNLGIV